MPSVECFSCRLFFCRHKICRKVRQPSTVLHKTNKQPFRFKFDSACSSPVAVVAVASSAMAKLIQLMSIMTENRRRYFILNTIKYEVNNQREQHDNNYCPIIHHAFSGPIDNRQTYERRECSIFFFGKIT